MEVVNEAYLSLIRKGGAFFKKLTIKEVELQGSCHIKKELLNDKKA